MSSKKIDYVLLVVGALLAAISGSQLFWGSGLTLNVQNILGELGKTRSVVKTKNPQSLDWRDAGEGNLLGDNQLIYTDADSSAEVSFHSGDSLTISANSLVRLRNKSGTNGLDIKKGTVTTVLKSGEAIAVGFNGKEYFLQSEGADIQISMAGESGEIGVLNGEVSLMTGDKSIRLNEKTALSVSESGIEQTTIIFKTLLPHNEEDFFVDAPFRSMHFQWVPDETVNLHLAKDASFADERIFTSQSGYTQNIEPGLWFWKVKGKTGSSLTQSFRIVKEVSPQILRPRLGDEVLILASKEGKSEILLQWKGLEEKYELEWTQNQVSKKLIVSGKVQSIPLEDSSSFSWRVRVLDAKRPDALWSSWQDVNLKIVNYPKTPTDLYPHEVEYQIFNLNRSSIFEGTAGPELTWKSEGKVLVEYQNPEGTVNEGESESSFFKDIITMNGDYKWRVAALDSEGRQGDWSEWKKFSVRLITDRVVQDVQRIQLEKPDQEVSFTWDSPEGSEDVFELSDDDKFQNVIIKQNLNAKTTKVTIPEAGTFYWRSRQYLPDGKFTISEPVKVIIEPIPAPTKPEKAPDLEVPIEWKSKSVPKSSWVDFFISSAHASDEFTSLVKLQIPKSSKAKSYVLRVFRDQSLKDLVFEQRLTEPNYVWENAQPGTYYWQYAIVDFWDRTSPFSDFSQLTVRDTPQIQRPKLLSPIRSVDVEIKDLELQWSEAGTGATYFIEVSDDPEFKNIITSSEKRDLSFRILGPLKPMLHYWRVTARKNNSVMMSNTGRFNVLPLQSKIEAPSEVQGTQKHFRSKIMVSWVPSMDTFDFKDNSEKGTIDGSVLNGIELKGFWLKENYFLSGEVLRQSGKVYKSEEYLLERILVSGFWKFDLGVNTRFGAGLSFGQTSGQSYEIDNSVVSATSVSGFSYGPCFTFFQAWSEIWEFQGKGSYLLGAIQQIDLLAEAIRHSENFFLIGGVGMSSRRYELSSGEQSSLRISFGMGKEF